MISGGAAPSNAPGHDLPPSIQVTPDQCGHDLNRRREPISRCGEAKPVEKTRPRNRRAEYRCSDDPSPRDRIRDLDSHLNIAGTVDHSGLVEILGDARNV